MYDLRRLLPVFALALLVAACHGGDRPAEASAPAGPDYGRVAVPLFDADSAYRFVADQLAFGFRTPNSAAHDRCAVYLARQMRRWCDTVVVQGFATTLWDGSPARGMNIIASLESPAPTATGKRILLAAHWDSRRWADHDPDAANQRKPIPGANDGASGVGVLMELARVASAMRPAVSLDFVFFDIEDQGCPEWAEEYVDDSWCKGSQYWSLHPHVPFYTAVYGILLDMVGTEGPRYTKEQISRQFAGGVTNKLWNAAAALGYDGVFVNADTDPILDDHYYVNRLAGIPMVDVVQNSRGCSFFPFWHTLEDDLGHIDKDAMRITAEVILKTIYADYGIQQPRP